MNVHNCFAATIGIAALMVVAVACGDGDSTLAAAPTATAAPITTPAQTTPNSSPATSATRTPTVAKRDAEKSAEIRVECEATVELALENPMLIARGVDPIPSGFDAVNSAGCHFESPASLVTLELHRSGKKVFAQGIGLDPGIPIVRFPLAGEKGDAIPADLELGSYDRLIKVTSVDSSVKVVRSDPDSVWLFDPTSFSKADARLALIGARRVLVDSLAIPYAGPPLNTLEPVEWGDASLGCPKPDVMYAQVVTPGFQLVFEYEGQQYEYHTDQDGSTVARCEVTSPSASALDSTIFCPQQRADCSGPRVRLPAREEPHGQVLGV